MRSGGTARVQPLKAAGHEFVYETSVGVRCRRRGQAGSGRVVVEAEHEGPAGGGGLKRGAGRMTNEGSGRCLAND